MKRKAAPAASREPDWAELLRQYMASMPGAKLKAQLRLPDGGYKEAEITGVVPGDRIIEICIREKP